MSEKTMTSNKIENSEKNLFANKGVSWSWLRKLINLVDDSPNTQELIQKVQNSFIDFLDYELAELFLIENHDDDEASYEQYAIDSLAQSIFFDRSVIEDIFLNKVPCRVKKNEIVLPLETNTKVIGLIHLKSKINLSDEDHELLWSFTDQLASIIDNLQNPKQYSPQAKTKIKDISKSIFNNLKGFLEASIERLKVLEEQNSQLVKLNETRTELINNVSHELRTPLVSIMGFSKILQRQEIKPDLILEASEQIQSAGSRLSRMIDDLIQLNRANTKGWDVNVERLDIGEIAKFVIDTLAPLNKKHSFTTRFPPDYPLIEGDRKLLRQVVENLILNAIKYSPDGGEIQAIIEIDQENSEISLSIKDQGIGMTEEDNMRAFDRFYRAKNQKTENIPGLGLGLSICKDVIEALNGKILSTSQFNNGSTFTVVMPL